MSVRFLCDYHLRDCESFLCASYASSLPLKSRFRFDSVLRISFKCQSRNLVQLLFPLLLLLLIVVVVVFVRNSSLHRILVHPSTGGCFIAKQLTDLVPQKLKLAINGKSIITSKRIIYEHV